MTASAREGLLKGQGHGFLRKNDYYHLIRITINGIEIGVQKRLKKFCDHEMKLSLSIKKPPGVQAKTVSECYNLSYRYKYKYKYKKKK
jgi:hypothetical protein